MNANTTNTHLDEPTMYAYLVDSTILACISFVATQDPEYQCAYHLDSRAIDHISNNRKSFFQIRCLTTLIGICLSDNKII